MVKRFISRLLISICSGDILILKDNSVHKGALVYYGNDEIIFKPLPPSEKTFVNIKDIKELKLYDGTTAFKNGTLKEPEEIIRQYIKMVILSHSRNESEVIMNYFAVLFLVFVAYNALLELEIPYPHNSWGDFNYNNADN